MLQSGAWFLRLAPTATDYHLLHFLSQIDVRSLFDRRPFEFQGDEYQLTWQWVEHRPRHIQALEQASLTLSRAEYDTLTSDPTFMFPIVGRWLTTANEVPHLWIEVVPHASLVDSFANTSPRNSRMFASSMSDVAAAVERLHRAGLRHGALHEGCLFVSKSLSGVRIGEWSRLRVNDDGNQLDEASLAQMKQRMEQRWFAGHVTGRLLEGAPRFRSNIVRVRFAAHSTCFSADTLVTRLGDYVVVPGDRGINVGEVIEVDCIASCVAPVERLATPVEAALAAELAAVDRSSLLTEVRHYVYEFAATKKASDMLQLEVLAVETQFDHAKLTVYYRHRAGGAVRLAPLIAFLFLRFRRRIWMQPVASRVMSPIPVCAPVA